MPATVETVKKPEIKPGGASTGSASEKSSKRKGVVTRVLWSLALFGAINAGLWTFVGDGKKSSSDANCWNSGASVEETIRGFEALKQKPDVILLGSSLVMFPFWAMDAAEKKNIDDIFHYHGSEALKKQLKAAGCGQENIYSLAVFGQMASDAYLMTSEFVKGDKTPKVIIYGIAPRDFHDHSLSSPMATFSFQKIVNLSNFPNYASAFLPDFEKKADWLAMHLCYFYGKRWRLQMETDKAINKVYSTLGIANPLDSSGTKSDTAAQGGGFNLEGSTEDRWNNSVKEYQGRYKEITEKDHSLQMSFLARTLNNLRERGVKVVLVNMPLTKRNLEILPPGFYASYQKEIAKVADMPGVKLVDLGDSKDFDDNDYWDTTHLNHVGGHKLLNHVVPAVKELL
ncbi:MAG: hypothetical protein DKT66_01240 [Candidatus Melainabacteria bacterium]|nr:MAG: hypothetical protein DKT66_01240 [Candidatus Melainabacteria bacterium]